MANSRTDESFLKRLRDGSDSAAQELNQRYRRQLCRLVERELDQRFRRREDAEDIVQSALGSFFKGLGNRTFNIDHTGALWRLLEQKTLWKMLKHIDYMDAAKRTPKAEVACGDGMSSGDPSSLQSAIAADLIEKTLEQLSDSEAEAFRLRLEGCTIDEIAAELGCSHARARAKVKRVRLRLDSVLQGRE